MVHGRRLAAVVVAVEARVDGETVTFDLEDVASGSPSEGDREEATLEGPCHAETEAPDAESPEASSGRRPRPHFTLVEYVDLVRAMAETDPARSADRPHGVSRWLARTTVLRKRQRASNRPNSSS